MPRVWVSRVAIGTSAAVGLYAAFLALLLFRPSAQRFALYAHHFNTRFIQNVDDGEHFGFAKHQVTPFNITTADGETLYAWHILPIDVYTRHEKALLAEPDTNGPSDNFTQSLPFRLLRHGDSPDRPARVVVKFHGNAGHIGDGWRPDTYRIFATQPNTHVIAIDYRGFGRSTGKPTETGLIIDGIATVNWLLQEAKVPAERIVLFGQSLGTAVASAVSLHFADPNNVLIPQHARDAVARANSKPEVFAGIVLVAPFYSLPSLMRYYHIGGFLPPVFLPLHHRWTASAYSYVISRIVDTWYSGKRLAAYYQVLKDSSKLKTGYADPESGHDNVRELGAVQLIHAVNDADIWFHQSRMICGNILAPDYQNECVTLQAGDVLEVRASGRPKIRVDINGHGGHNVIQTYSTVSAAVARAFEGL